MGMRFVDTFETRDDTIFHRGEEREREREASRRDGRLATDPLASPRQLTAEFISDPRILFSSS